MLPVTEQGNPMTREIDVAVLTEDGSAGVRMLRAAEIGIFAGSPPHVSLSDAKMLKTIEAVASAAEEVLRAGSDGIIVMSGCGTSGRIAFLVSRACNAYLHAHDRSMTVQYLVSGGDKAIMMSDELPEDDAVGGAAELKALIAGKSKVLFIGISCGLSAPYVAGQLDAALDTPGTHTVMMGFNPVHLARDVVVEGWDKTFLQVAKRVWEVQNSGGAASVLNPAVGPEPISGSSRMKGGSATRVLLDACLGLALSRVVGDTTMIAPDATAAHIVHLYEKTMYRTYSGDHTTQIAQMARTCGQCVSNNGHIYHVGGGEVGPMSLVDISEMPDTYGASFDEFRGFVEGGWSTVANRDGDLSSCSHIHRIDLDHFFADIQPNLGENDHVILSCGDAGLTSGLMAVGNGAKAKNALVSILRIGTNQQWRAPALDGGVEWSHVVDIVLDRTDLLTGMNSLLEFSAKLVLNAISTLAQVRKGMVMHNMMINLGVSNNKLFHRSVKLIMDLMHVDIDVATKSLIRAIHDVDQLTEDLQSAPIRMHLEVATPKPRVLPLALLIANGMTVEEGKSALQKQPVVRGLLQQAK